MSISKFVYYENDGTIRKIFTGPKDEVELNRDEGHSWLEVGSESEIDVVSYYVASGTIREKTPYPKPTYNPEGTLGEVHVIDHMKGGTRVLWPDGYESVESGRLSFETNVGGYWTFILEHPMHFETEVIIHVA